MTKREIAELCGWTSVTIINRAFKEAEKECPSIKAKTGHYNKIRSVDYTLEEFLIASKYITNATYTPVMEQYIIEHFIERPVPFKEREQKPDISKDVKNFLWQYAKYGHRWKSCVTCAYVTPRTFEGTLRKERPYCTFYECFLHKVKPKRNVYFDYCPTFMKTDKEPFIYTPSGAVLFSNYKKKDTSMTGTPQSAFKSKREKNEPIYILKDVYSEY